MAREIRVVAVGINRFREKHFCTVKKSFLDRINEKARALITQRAIPKR